MLAIRNADMEGNEMLIYDANGRTKLHVAAADGTLLDVKSVLDTLDKGEDINCRDIVFGATALHLATAEGHNDVIALLLDGGADINVRENEYGATALYIAVNRKHFESVQLLIARGSDVNARDMKGRTALFTAAYLGVADILTALLEAGALIEIHDHDRGATPLHEAVAGNQCESVSLLVSHGAEIDSVDRDEWTPLHLAVKGGLIEVATLLLDLGADVNKEAGRCYYSPLDLAEREKNSELIKLIRSRGGKGSTHATSTVLIPDSRIAVVIGGRIFE